MFRPKTAGRSRQNAHFDEVRNTVGVELDEGKGVEGKHILDFVLLLLTRARQTESLSGLCCSCMTEARTRLFVSVSVEPNR